jgi:hypothetical protein
MIPGPDVEEKGTFTMEDISLASGWKMDITRESEPSR